MVVLADPELFDFTTEEALDEFGESILPRIQIVAEYDAEVYSDLYVDEGLVADVGGEAAYAERQGKVESFLRLDLIDRNAYREIVPGAGRAELFVTQAAEVLLIRRFRDGKGLFVSVRRNGVTDPLIEAIDRIVDGGD